MRSFVVATMLILASMSYGQSLRKTINKLPTVAARQEMLESKYPDKFYVNFAEFRAGAGLNPNTCVMWLVKDNLAYWVHASPIGYCFNAGGYLRGALDTSHTVITLAWIDEKGKFQWEGFTVGATQATPSR